VKKIKILKEVGIVSYSKKVWIISTIKECNTFPIEHIENSNIHHNVLMFSWLDNF